MDFNAYLRCFSPTSRRFWRPWRAISRLLQVGISSGRALEVFLGHRLLFVVLERGAGYEFVEASYGGRSALRPSVIAELKAFGAIMPTVAVIPFFPWWSWRRGSAPRPR